MNNNIETIKFSEDSYGYSLVACCYICGKPVQYANDSNDLPRYPQICRKCKDAILWARSRMEKEKTFEGMRYDG